jgi:hypothetical protein
MDLLKISTMLEALKLELQKYDKIEDLQAQEGCNISSKKRSKVLISWPK